MNGTIVASQIGARMHYAVPRILHSHGLLERLYTDICATKGWPKLLGYVPDRMMPATARRLAGRIPKGVPEDRITTFDGMGLASVLGRMRSRSKPDDTLAMIRSAEQFSRHVVRRGFGDARGFYGISAECVEQVEAARGRGIHTAVEQIIAPRQMVEALVATQAERFPEWEGGPSIDPHAAQFAAREAAEWQASDVILCPSEFVREGIRHAGGPVDKCVVVPYGVDSRFNMPSPRLPGDKLKVLTVGAVGLRKGSPYVLQAARRLANAAEFRMVGPLPAREEPRRALSAALDLRGQVPRSEIVQHFAWADVFLLPSICEGSATVIYEALAAGLPVVTTPNAGSVVHHGLDGFVVPAGDGDAIVEFLEIFARDRDLLEAMARSARMRAASYDLDHYADTLIPALERGWHGDAGRYEKRPGATGQEGGVRQ